MSNLKPMDAVAVSELASSHHDRNQLLVAGFENWMVMRHFASSTCRLYVGTAHAFVHHIGSASVQDKTAIRSFLVEASTGGSRGQHSAIRCRLRSFYKFLVLAGVVSTAWRVSIPVLKIAERLPRVLTEEEVERLLGSARRPLDKALLEFAYATGLRASELSTLRIEDLDFQAGSVLVRQGKGKKDRIGFFGSRARDALTLYLKNRNQGPVFLGKLGRNLTRSGIYQMVRRAAACAGIDGVHPHTLRHCFASHLLNRGADIRYVQELLGHKNLSATQLYTHVAMTDLRREHARLHSRKGESDEKA